MLPKIYVDVDADITGAEKGINRLSKTVDGLGNSISANSNRLSSGMVRAANTVKLNNAQLANMQYQLNDIGVMLASGQSPFVMLMQQGMQIGQIFGPGATVSQALKATGAGIMSFLTNPINLAIFGFASAAGAASYLWNAFSGPEAKTAEETLTGFSDILDKIKVDFPEIAQEAKNFLDVFNGGTAGMIAGLQKSKSEIKAGLQKSLEEVGDVVKSVGVLMKTDMSPGAMVVREIHDLGQALLDGKITAADFAQTIAEIRIADNTTPEMKEYADRILEASDNAIRLEAALKASEVASERLSNSLGRVMVGMSAGLAERMGITNIAEELQRQAETLAANDNKSLGRTSRAKTGLTDQDRLKEQLQKRLETLMGGLMTETETVNAWYEKSLSDLDNALAQKLIKETEYADARVRLEQEMQQRLTNLRQNETNRTLSTYANFFGSMASLAKAGGEKTFGVVKALSIAEALINSYKAYTQVLADPFYVGRPFLRQIAAASVMASGLAQVASIRSVSSSGGGGGGSRGGRGGGGGGMGGGGGRGGRSQNVAIQLTGGNLYDRGQVIGLINAINEATEDGAKIRLVS